MPKAKRRFIDAKVVVGSLFEGTFDSGLAIEKKRDGVVIRAVDEGHSSCEVRLNKEQRRELIGWLQATFPKG